MKNQKGEVVTGVVILMMAGMMILGMIFMPGAHGVHKEHAMSNQLGYSETAQDQMRQSEAEKAGREYACADSGAMAQHQTHQSNAENAHQTAVEGNGDHQEHTMSNQRGSETAQHHMHQGDVENAQQPATGEKK